MPRKLTSQLAALWRMFFKWQWTQMLSWEWTFISNTEKEYHKVYKCDQNKVFEYLAWHVQNWYKAAQIWQIWAKETIVKL